MKKDNYIMRENKSDIGTVFFCEDLGANSFIEPAQQVKSLRGVPRFTFTSVLQTPGINYNRNEYIMQSIMDAVSNDKNLMSTINRHEWFGESDHPMLQTKDQEISAQRIAKIDSSRRSHRINKIWMEGETICGSIDTFPATEVGRAMDASIAMGGIPAFSMRGFGNAEQRNGKTMIKVYKLITYDYVSAPSHFDAFARPETIQLKESVNKFTDGSNGEIKIITEETEDGDVVYSRAMCNVGDMIKKNIKNDKQMNIIMEAFDLTEDMIKTYNPKSNSVFFDKGSSKIITHASQEVYDKFNDLVRRKYL
jgi:DNA polymerase III delta prime subunit